MSLKESNDVVLTKTFGIYDITIDSNGDFTTDNFFDTAVIVSLTTDKRASAQEVLSPEFRRGWIGNESTAGFEIGSKNWLYHQARRTRTNLNGLQSSSSESLNWMREMKIVESLDVVANYGSNESAVITINAVRTGNKISKNYPIWENTGK